MSFAVGAFTLMCVNFVPFMLLWCYVLGTKEKAFNRRFILYLLAGVLLTSATFDIFQNVINAATTAANKSYMASEAMVIIASRPIWLVLGALGLGRYLLRVGESKLAILYDAVFATVWILILLYFSNSNVRALREQYSFAFFFASINISVAIACVIPLFNRVFPKSAILGMIVASLTLGILIAKHLETCQYLRC